MGVFYVYNDVFLETFYDVELLFERDQLGMTWETLRKKRRMSLGRIKREYETTLLTYYQAKRYPAARARVEWFNRYIERIDWKEYKDIEFDVLYACGLYRETHLGGDTVTLHEGTKSKEHRNDRFKSFTYDQDLLNDLIIERMAQLVKMKKKAAKVLIDIEWVKGE